MTVIAVLADPPREGLVLPDLPETSPLSTAEATELYAAMLKDTFVAAANSGGELLVNYRANDDLPDEFAGEESAEARLRALAREALDDLDDARFEPQVGSSFDARAGNTATHLLEEEDAQSVAVVDGTAPMLTRKEIDSAAMKLRRSEVVLGPAGDGRAYFLGLTDTIDFEGAYATPALETLAHRATDAGHAVDFLPRMTAVETGADLRSLLPVLNARVAADRIVPVNTTTYLNDLDLRVEERDGGPALVR
ncbi:TIGR04282 family arsenosugar biosynthesis glycosyltransferase [Halomicrococcus sp. NG-SE-24]|uniref:TIGR04282 family arsenosugar biosynthesis glycosyltransferase n=1 Tax=Halomicrococcus sp. NG-SE-24 TaxID=3436928 RepID=UPI003D99A787